MTLILNEERSEWEKERLELIRIGEEITEKSKIKLADGQLPFRPIFNRVLLKRDQLESQSKLLIIPDSAKKSAPSTGMILEVGGTCDDPVKELKGKRVMFSRFAGDWLKFPGIEEEYYICSDEDILGELNY